MIGVVLWSDRGARKAILWCEDHGDLAYYTSHARSGQDGTALDVGDVVAFDLLEEGGTRYVCAPRLVSEEEFPALPAALAGRRPATGEAEAPAQAAPEVSPAIARWQALCRGSGHAAREDDVPPRVAVFSRGRQPRAAKEPHPA